MSMKQRHIETPWGPSQHQREHAPGIVFHSTASHGGYHLSTERWKDFTAIPQFANWPSPWLEEDCDASLVYLRWPELATDEQIHDAVCMVRGMATLTNDTGRWQEMLVWIKEHPELLSREQAHLEAVKHLWQRGSMSSTKQHGIWRVSFSRRSQNLAVYMDYPTKRYYSDAELESVSRSPKATGEPDAATTKFFNDRHDARVAAGNQSLFGS